MRQVRSKLEIFLFFNYHTVPHNDMHHKAELLTNNTIWRFCNLFMMKFGAREQNSGNHTCTASEYGPHPFCYVEIHNFFVNHRIPQVWGGGIMINV